MVFDFKNNNVMLINFIYNFSLMDKNIKRIKIVDLKEVDYMKKFVIL